MCRFGILRENRMNYRILLCYDGTRYDGWQKQGNTDKTIQGKLEALLERLMGETVEVQGSGRTDRGVHAEGQAAHFHLNSGDVRKKLMEKSGEKSSWNQKETIEDIPGCLMSYMNHYLPEDIAVTDCREAEPRFHSRLSAVRKTYRYQLEQGDKKDVFLRDYYYGVGQQLDLEAMKEGASYLTGTHDFKSFCGNPRMKKTTVRTIDSIWFQQLDGGKLHIRYRGNGFLQQMVRILTGTLIEIGKGEKKPREILEILEAKDRRTAGFTAPAQGLFLESVEYEEDITGRKE